MKRQFQSRIFLLSLCAAILSAVFPSWATESITGTVIDCHTQRPIEGAWVTAGTHVQRTNHDGRFQIPENDGYIDVRAIGYSRKRAAAKGGACIGLNPIRVHGLYLSFWGVGSQTLRSGVLDTIERAHLNAVVIDVKSDRGFISLKTDSPMADRAGSNKTITIPAASALLKGLHARGLYCIARIVVFKDNPLARNRTDLAVKRASGALFVDREGLAWTDPFNHTVWDYNIAIAIEAAKAGFDEIQFDYVRFPDEKGLRFTKESNQVNRRQAITDFLATARERLTPYNVFLSADNFGYACWNVDDTGIGQCFADIGVVVDYISPMLYPSSFQFGIPGVRNPLKDPYQVVFASLERAKQRTGFPSLVFRPWLQAFNDYAFDHRRFGKVELERQIRAAQDANSDGWMLWDPRNRYDAKALAQLATELHW